MRRHLALYHDANQNIGPGNIAIRVVFEPLLARAGALQPDPRCAFFLRYAVAPKFWRGVKRISTRPTIVTEQIRDLLRLSSEQHESCADVCVIAEYHLEAVEDKLADLRRHASELCRIHSSCSGRRPMAECRIIEVLSHD